eukprot:GHVN01005999.1.p1 GENE.GHVN01005999.1~~GHVN01005999.1.p1  ORF type:complete len:391 (+),score=95.06 GHVN01005999.1:170-1342(+)
MGLNKLASKFVGRVHQLTPVTSPQILEPCNHLTQHQSTYLTHLHSAPLTRNYSPHHILRHSAHTQRHLPGLTQNYSAQCFDSPVRSVSDRATRGVVQRKQRFIQNVMIGQNEVIRGSGVSLVKEQREGVSKRRDRQRHAFTSQKSCFFSSNNSSESPASRLPTTLYPDSHSISFNPSPPEALEKPPSDHPHSAPISPHSAPVSPHLPRSTGHHDSPFVSSFHEMGINSLLVENLAGLHSHVSRPTRVQQRAFGPITARRDVVMNSPTGTGKTLAYLLPLLNSVYDAHDFTAMEGDLTDNTPHEARIESRLSTPLAQMRPWVIITPKKDLNAQIIANIQHLDVQCRVSIQSLTPLPQYPLPENLTDLPHSYTSLPHPTQIGKASKLQKSRR